MDIQEEQGMEQFLYGKKLVKVKPGEVIKGKVVQVEPATVFVDVGGKAEGTIALDELSFKPVQDPNAVVKIGDELDVYVLRQDEEGNIHLSRKRAELEQTWVRIKEAMDSGKTLQGTIIEQVKGGLVVDMGVRGFIPASHMRMGKYPVRNLEDYVGETLPLKVLEIDRQRGRVVLSYRQAAEEESSKKKGSFWKNIFQGEFRKGTVARFADFGAFVDLGGVDGLIHLSELSWRRVKHPSEVLKIGDTVETMVLGFDQARERVSLSLRRALPDPWTQLPATFVQDARVEGTVTRIAKRYAFVEVFPGVEGLVPAAELKTQTIKEGEKISARIAEIRPEAHRLVLSLSEARKEEKEDSYQRYLKEHEDRPLTIKDILGEKLNTELGGG